MSLSEGTILARIPPGRRGSAQKPVKKEYGMVVCRRREKNPCGGFVCAAAGQNPALIAFGPLSELLQLD